MSRRQHGPVSLRVSVTEECQLRCIYCRPGEEEPRGRRTAVLGFEQILRFVRVLKLHFGLSKVRITGGEPLLRPGVEDLISMLYAEGVPDIALTTNGLLLEEKASALKRAGLHRVTVSLDSLDGATFSAVTRGGELGKVIAGVEEARRLFDVVKINCLLMRGYNDTEAASLTRWAIERGCGIRFIELMPLGCARAFYSALFVPASEVMTRLRRSFYLMPLPYGTGCTSRDYLASDGAGRGGVVGFITPITRPFCAGCRRLRLTAAGRLIYCLAKGEGPCIADMLERTTSAAERALVGEVERSLRRKTDHSPFSSERGMVLVGG